MPEHNFKYYAVLYGKSTGEKSGWYEKEKLFKSLAAAIKWAEYAADTFNGIEVPPVVIGADTKGELEKKRGDYWRHYGAARPPYVIYQSP